MKNFNYDDFVEMMKKIEVKIEEFEFNHNKAPNTIFLGNDELRCFWEYNKHADKSLVHIINKVRELDVIRVEIESYIRVAHI